MNTASRFALKYSLSGSFGRAVCFAVQTALLLAMASPSLLAQCPTCPSPPKVDWTTMASKYTHDVQGQRVHQYAVGVEPLSNERPDFERSGYRHYRSTLQAGNSADNVHIVESWGRPVRPYEEWRFPFRPYSVPYDLWGPQPPNFGVLPFGGYPPVPTPFGFGAGGGPGFGAPYGFAPRQDLLPANGPPAQPPNAQQAFPPHMPPWLNVIPTLRRCRTRINRLR